CLNSDSFRLSGSNSYFSFKCRMNYVIERKYGADSAHFARYFLAQPLICCARWFELGEPQYISFVKVFGAGPAPLGRPMVFHRSPKFISLGLHHSQGDPSVPIQLRAAPAPCIS